MKDKILFWLDVNLVYFGIAKYLQEKLNSNFYAIIDINNSTKPFFQNQELVHFKKTWFYRDHIKNLDEPLDLEYLKKFEDRYSINLWNIAYGDRLFVDYNNYYNFTDKEILKIFEMDVKLFENILDEIEPNFLIMKITDNQQNHLFHEICKFRGIKILTVNYTRLGERHYISSDYDVFDNKDEFLNFKSSSNPLTFDELNDKISNYSKIHNKFLSKHRVSTTNHILASLKFLLFICNAEYRKYFENFGRFRFRVLKNELSLLLKKYFRSQFLNKNSKHDTPHGVDFVYFPMHFEPERTVLISAPYFSNQLEVIRSLSKSLPAGMKLCVKEHPRMRIYGWHSISYYKKILTLPNVVFFHPNISNEKLLSNCSLVATISGSAGFEVLSYAKPTIVFTDTVYSMLSCVTKINNLNDLPHVIQNTLKKKVDLLELNCYVQFLESNSFECNLAELTINMFQTFYHGGFLVDVTISTSDMISFLEENSVYFNILANEFLKKLDETKIPSIN